MPIHMTTKRVPAALHAELTEHANLVRALRTARTLDLTAHLLHRNDNGDNDPGAAWTLWPLIDCPVPEWSLPDEIQLLADAVARHHHGHAGNTSEAEDAADLDGVLPATAANLAIFHTAALLVRILNLLADQRPSAPGSMQNRLRPMDWEDVLALLAVSGLVAPSVVARAEKRLERIYGPSHTHALQRLESAAATKKRFAERASAHEDQLFAPPIIHSRPRRKDDRVDRTRTNDDDSGITQHALA